MEKAEGPPRKDAHVLIPGTCNWVVFYGRRGFAGIIKVIDLKIGRLSWIIWVGPV